jgi:hypothetical protein
MRSYHAHGEGMARQPRLVQMIEARNPENGQQGLGVGGVIPVRLERLELLFF